MKRILLACCLIAVSGTAVMAQSAKTAPAQNQAADPKQTFASLVNEVEANLSRSNGEVAKTDYFKLAGMMQDKMAATQKALDGASSESQKKSLASSLKTQQQLYVDAKVLSSDMTKNQKELVTKLRAFLELY
jgi:hypothetical protein